MAGVTLYPYQEDAIHRLRNGSILCGGVGSGKSRTSLAYYYILQGGRLGDEYVPMVFPQDLYIITTARKRDTHEWEDEMDIFKLRVGTNVGLYKHTVVVDSWNNIAKYVDVKDAFFIFDEQRVVGYGKWSKSFIKIARHNDWILLSATPGDSWSDYIPVFIANGFYKNKSDFEAQHVVWSRWSNFPKVDRYINTGRLVRERNDILVKMNYHRETKQNHQDIPVMYPKGEYQTLATKRWNIYKDAPVENISELCYLLRRVTNEDPSRQVALLDVLEKHPKAILFYNFDYELDILRKVCSDAGFEIAEWNGHKHEPIPIEKEKWCYLVQYTAGCEGWNCIETDTIIFFSQNYSYKVMVQAAGRIDRLNTPFEELYYFHLKSKSPIDLAIANALRRKENFNETKFMKL